MAGTSFAIQKEQDDFQVVILLGRPGCGKGTIAESLLKEDSSYKHISMGDVFRQELANKTDLGIKFKKEIETERGFLPDEIVVAVVRNFLEEAIEKGRKIVLDGFPRTKKQLNEFENILKSKNASGRVHYFYVNIPPEVAKARILDRLVCPKCHLVYHKKWKVPKKPEICDECSSFLQARPADVAEAIEDRFKSFEKNMLQVVHYIEERGSSNFYELKGESPVSENCRTIFDILS